MWLWNWMLLSVTNLPEDANNPGRSDINHPSFYNCYCIGQIDILVYPFMQDKRFRNIFCEYVRTWIKVDVIPLTVWWPALEKQRERGWGDRRWHSRTCNGPSSSNVNTKHKLEDVNHLYVHYLFIQFCNAMKVHSASNAVLNFYVVMTTAWATVVDPILISLLLTVKHQRFFDSDCSILLEQLGVGWRQIKNSFSCICTQQKFTS